jgi:hypothetical protein
MLLYLLFFVIALTGFGQEVKTYPSTSEFSSKDTRYKLYCHPPDQVMGPHCMMKGPDNRFIWTSSTLQIGGPNFAIVSNDGISILFDDLFGDDLGFANLVIHDKKGEIRLVLNRKEILLLFKVPIEDYNKSQKSFLGSQWLEEKPIINEAEGVVNLKIGGKYYKLKFK